MSEIFLKDRTALVTGSIQGIGLAIACSLAKSGANIALHGLGSDAEKQKALETVMAAGSPDVRFFDADFSSPAEIDHMMDEILAWHDVDILVNNAGIQKVTSIADATAEIWDAVIGVNLSAAFHTMRHLLPPMAERGYGRVINIASVQGLIATKEKAPYVASKHGLVGLSKVAALEYADAGNKDSGGVTINCICPGWTETPLIEPQIDARMAIVGGDRAAGIASLLAEKQPTKRTSSPSEIGEATVWLCHRFAHNITGISLPIDGGWTAQ